MKATSQDWDHTWFSWGSQLEKETLCTDLWKERPNHHLAQPVPMNTQKGKQEGYNLSLGGGRFIKTGACGALLSATGQRWRSTWQDAALTPL